MDSSQKKEGDVTGEEKQGKVEEDSNFLNESGHAKVNDPVEPPARHAPKGRESLESTSDEAPSTPTSASAKQPIDPNSILTRLFDPDRMQKPAIWKFIKLVAPGPAGQPPPGCLKWRSKDAVAAYCLKCKKQFTYTKGTSKTISRHMMAYHGLINTDGDTDVSTGTPDQALARSRSTGTSGKEPPLKKRKQSVSKGDSQPLVLLKWLVGSFRPLSIIQDPGFKELIYGLPESYTKEDVLSLARTKVETVKAELHQQLTQCDDYSLAYEMFENQGEPYCSVRITFCTATFERNSFTIKVAPCKSRASVVEEALQEYDLSAEKISTVTQKHAAIDSAFASIGAQLNVSTEFYSPCSLNTMDDVVMTCMSTDPTKQLVAVIREHVKNHKPLCNAKDAYLMIQEFLDLPNNDAKKEDDVAYPTTQQQSMAKALGEMLKPFYDATKTLSGEPYPMMTIPVFRRINDVLDKVDVKESLGSAFEATSMEQFRQALSAAFSQAFSSILDGSSPFMWTIPIDPRLIHMKGLSSEEKEKVTATLIDNVKQLKLSLSSSTDEEVMGNKVSGKGSKQETSTMAGLFFGDDAEMEESTDSGTEATAAAYARTSVDRYLDAVKSNRRIDDPLSWWNQNREQFPELAMLARKWLGASAIYVEAGAKNGRESYPGDNLDVVSFLHDNIGLL